MVELDVDRLVANAISDSVTEAVKQRLSGYQSPLIPIVDHAIAQNEQELRKLLFDAVAGCAADEEFRSTIKDSVKKRLAKLLVERFGGELEKQVNLLKSDPTTRARITVAIDEIVSGSSK